jgi:hypothetical protein
MNAQTHSPRGLLAGLLALLALGLLAAIYFSPIWWVSLTAPNYPPESFPDGVRIHFHMNGVFNGCQKIEKAEIHEDEALDCVHEMDTINHYVGMYPIAAGGVVERAFSPFIISLLGVMIIGFVIPKTGLRLVVMGAGFAAILGWMSLTMYGEDGLQYQNSGYLTAMVTALDQEGGIEKEAPKSSAADALLARLKAELAETPAASAPPKVEDKKPAVDKENLIDSLESRFEKTQERLSAAERQEWTGSGIQTLLWHYQTSLGRYFNDPALIGPMVKGMALATHAFFWVMVGAMLLLLWGARKSSGMLYWFLIIAPLALPLFFIVDYAAWLWWYGHTLSDMGAFTVKPFMPTVFGDGKVAQFATHSYPALGFGLMVLLSGVLAVLALVKRKGMREAE